MRELGWLQEQPFELPTAKIPLQFNCPPVEVITKELTKLNSSHPQRICYLGPRWENSLLFHKRFSGREDGYTFTESKATRGSNAINDSMTHNQFYRNQFYYRAFEGMNPTISQDLLFESRFECGNLDCAIKIAPNEYDLFLRIDSNTRGHLAWYYFSVRNGEERRRIKLNICNLTKNGTHYSRGLHPFLFSSIRRRWTQEGVTNVSFAERRLKYDFLYERMKVETYFELSFEIEMEKDEEVKLAYCIPYSYSQLLQDLQSIRGHAEVAVLGKTLTGISIPVVMVGRGELNAKKRVVMVTGRVHPSETNSSLLISTIIRDLCFSPELETLRENVIFMIVPMINPDGVILGNSRTGAAGMDLNRQFKTKNKALFPQIYLLKRLVDKIAQTHQIQLYLDLHGHSKKKNMFIYGPPYPITQPEYYKCRIFPKLLSNLTPLFRYYSCQFDIPHEKRGTARAVMLNQLMIPFVYTVETSLGFYYDYAAHRTEPFGKEKWEQLGQAIILALKEYYEGIMQYQEFLDSKRQSRKSLAEELRSGSSGKEKERKLPKEGAALRQIRFLSLFEEIKACQQKKTKEDRRQKEAELDSDSHDQAENLQKEKLYEFGRMVTDFIEEEEYKQRNGYSQKPKAKSRKDIIELSPDAKRRNAEMVRRRQKRWREEEQILNAEMVAGKCEKKRKEEQEVKKHRKSQLSHEQSHFQSIERSQLTSEQLHRGLSLNHQRQKLPERAKLIPSQQCLEQNLECLQGEKRVATTKMNIRMFNFEKTMSNQKSLRYSEGKEVSKVKQLNIHKNKNLSELKKRFDERKNLEEHLKKESPPSRTNFLQLDYIEEDEDASARKEEESLPANLNPAQKGKHIFPSSFYRIKYQNHKKRLEMRKNKVEAEQRGGEGKGPERQLMTIGLLEANGSLVERREELRKEGLFVKINRFPLL